MKPTCPYCQKVMRYIDENGIEITYKDIVADSALADELTARGGKRQVPYLVDDERGVEMYESDDIIHHLETYKA